MLYDKFKTRSSGSSDNSSNTSSCNRLSAINKCRIEPANVVTSLLDKLESLREIGAIVTRVAVVASEPREIIDGFRVAAIWEAIDPLRLCVPGEELMLPEVALGA